MVTVIQCPITGFDAEEFPPEGDFRRIRCRALGGDYEITGTADKLLSEVSPGNRLKVATYVSNERRLGRHVGRFISWLLQWKRLQAAFGTGRIRRTAEKPTAP